MVRKVDAGQLKEMQSFFCNHTGIPDEIEFKGFKGHNGGGHGELEFDVGVNPECSGCPVYFIYNNKLFVYGMIGKGGSEHPASYGYTCEQFLEKDLLKPDKTGKMAVNIVTPEEAFKKQFPVGLSTIEIFNETNDGEKHESEGYFDIFGNPLYQNFHLKYKEYFRTYCR